MAECRCGNCEHCIASPSARERYAPPFRPTPFTGTVAVRDTIPAPPPVIPRALLSHARLEFLRGPMGGGRMLTAEECRELVDAYETCERLLEEVVREARSPLETPGLVRASDVAWLKLREAQRGL